MTKEESDPIVITIEAVVIKMEVIVITIGEFGVASHDNKYLKLSKANIKSLPNNYTLPDESLCLFI